MSTGQALRALVNERLSAAADEIFALFERTITKYEQELCLYKEENQRKQERLDSVLSPRIKLLKAADAQTHTWNPDPTGMNQEMTRPVIKEEPAELSIPHEEEEEEEEEEELLTPESSVCVKTEEEEPSLLQQSDDDDETHGEDTLQTHSRSEEDEGHGSGRDDDGWGAPFSWSDVEKETEVVYGDHCYQLKIRDRSGAEPAAGLFSKIRVGARDGDAEPGTADGANKNKHQCCVCEKLFKTKQELRVHGRIHTGERPFSCPFCVRTFTQRAHLQSHVRIHTGDKPFSCPTCNKAFAHKGNLHVHRRLHTGERPYGCSICGKDFADISSQKKHLKSHARTALRLKRLKALV
ncbi:uncharacterized protein [Eucyclogobius newberryi]|uniref:uncharacterized protein n=1 Tax=Eucyclogobius newberryi TaxID=166745 RepID=UPI003B596FE6